MNGLDQDVTTDVRSVLVLLRERGPRTVQQLCVELEDGSWGRDRVEQAVAVAWSLSLVSLDVEDRLVAL
jgi:hypothetical protein